jgi:tetratricopeptide (TPR) repeat protein
MIFLKKTLRRTIKIDRHCTYASWCSLGLQNSPLVQHKLGSWKRLPDLTRALEYPDEPNALESLRQAYETCYDSPRSILKSQALLALTAEVQVMRGESPVKTLEQLTEMQQQEGNCDHFNKSLTKLALAKVNWMEGDFFPAAALCRELLEDDAPAVSAAARNGHSLCMLMIASTLEDLNNTLDPVRRNDWSSLPLAQLNFGAAEVIYGDVWHANSPDNDRPLEPALRQWKQGLSWFEGNFRDKGEALILQSQLNTNIAWGLLQLGDIEQASTYAEESLNLLQQHQPSIPLTLPLTILARCRDKSGSFQQADELFRSAISSTPRTLSEKLQTRYALRTYAARCKDRDKFDGDPKQVAAQAEQIALPEPWEHKSSYVYTSLWFWTPYEMNM